MPRSDSPRRFDPFLLVCIALGLFLFSPILASGLPQAPDGILHYYRSAIWRWAWDDGSLWPRWSTILFQGYGYSALSFNGQLPYLIVALSSYVLPSVMVGYKVILLLACLSYPVSMYLWAREVIDPVPALVAAAAYTFATSRFRELYFYGGGAQYLAWSLYPWVLYGFLRLAKTPGRGWFALATVSLASVALCHNIAAMLFAPVLAGYLVYLMVTYRRAWGWLVGAGALAVLISAICWVPALGETPFTRVHVLTEGHWNIRAHFIRFADLFAGSPPLDARADNPPVPFNYGVLHLPLALLGLATVFLKGQTRSRRAHVIIAGALVIVGTFMMLPQSYPAWDFLSFLRYAEYPWRIFGVALLGASLLAGAALEWLRWWPKWQKAAAAVLVLAIPASLLVYQFPRQFLQPVESPGVFLAYETAFNAIGTTGGNEFLPPWITELPKEPAVTMDLDRRALYNPRAGVSGKVVEVKAEALALEIEAETAGPVQLAQFYFPGWRGTINGHVAPLRHADKTGMIELDVPAGRSQVNLEFGTTPLRTAGAILTLVGLVALAVSLILLPGAESRGRSTKHGDIQFAWVTASLVIGFLLLKALWIEPSTEWFRQTSPPDAALPARHQLATLVGNQVKLLGYDLWPETLQPGQEMNITLYWQATGPVDGDLSSFVHLTAGPTAAVFAQSDRMHPGYIPSSTWSSDQYIVDSHRVIIPEGAPRVAYQVVVGLYELTTGKRTGATQLETKVYVVDPRGTGSAIQHPLAVEFADGLALAGYSMERTPDGLEVVLHWRSRQQASKDYQVFVHALDAQGDQLAGGDGPPVEGLYPTSRWLPGQIISDRHFVPLPPGAEPASLRLGLYDLVTLERLAIVNGGSAAIEDSAVRAPVSSP